MADQKVSQDDLNSLVQFGLSVQAIAAVIVYAARRNKLEFVKTVTEQVDRFIEGLSDVERSELEIEIKNMMDQKSEELLTSLTSELGEERAADLQKLMGSRYK